MGLLDTAPVLIVDQITFWLRSDFQITDPDGNGLGRIETDGGTMRRLLLGPRELTVYDETGAPYLKVLDPPDFGLDHFEIVDGNNEPLARVTKKLTFMTTKLSVNTYAGDYDLVGNLGAWELAVTGPAGEVANVTRTYRGIAEAITGRGTYAIQYPAETTEVDRRIALGCMIVVDLVLAKQRQRRAGGAGS
ncbi:MAG: hypothetical protein HZY73_08025 [Micropruina sp.]|nr:MAG: hypothetical protein HZY73_08025 [Micropruina sp.]